MAPLMEEVNALGFLFFLLLNLNSTLRSLLGWERTYWYSLLITLCRFVLKRDLSQLVES